MSVKISDDSVGEFKSLVALMKESSFGKENEEKGENEEDSDDDLII